MSEKTREYFKEIESLQRHPYPISAWCFFDPSCKDKTDKAPVIDVLKAGYMKACAEWKPRQRGSTSTTCWLLSDSVVFKSNAFQVCGKGQLPQQPVIVKARYFTKEAGKTLQVSSIHSIIGSDEAEQKIKDAGGVCVLCA